MTQIGIIGDIHGEATKLRRLLDKATSIADHLVFVGDYVNRGPNTMDVIELLISLQPNSCCTFLAGNHDEAMVAALEHNAFDSFLQMGGASTVRAYVSSPSADVESDFRAAVPRSHLRFLESLAHVFRAPGLVVTHSPRQLRAALLEAHGYGVCGHIPQVSLVPLLGRETAQIDTGCGTWSFGKLTCLLWPRLDWLQD